MRIECVLSRTKGYRTEFQNKRESNWRWGMKRGKGDVWMSLIGRFYLPNKIKAALKMKSSTSFLGKDDASQRQIFSTVVFKREGSQRWTWFFTEHRMRRSKKEGREVNGLHVCFDLFIKRSFIYKAVDLRDFFYQTSSFPLSQTECKGLQ